MKYFYCIVFCALLACPVYSQNYTQDAGIRVGEGFMVSYRHFFKDDYAVEIIGGFRDRGMRITGLKEYFRPVLTHRSDNFRFVYGYGVHTGFTYTNSHRFLHREFKYEEWKASPIFGVDGLVGIEYRFPDMPLVVSADMKPFFEYSLYRYFKLDLAELSISVKYRF